MKMKILSGSNCFDLCSVQTFAAPMLYKLFEAEIRTYHLMHDFSTKWQATNVAHKTAACDTVFCCSVYKNLEFHMPLSDRIVDAVQPCVPPVLKRL